jgi:hypothetical protein
MSSVDMIKIARQIHSSFLLGDDTAPRDLSANGRLWWLALALIIVYVCFVVNCEAQKRLFFNPVMGHASAHL